VRKNDTKVAKGELVFTSFLLVLSLVVLWDSFNLVEVGLNVIVGPKIFAIGVGFVLIGFGFVPTAISIQCFHLGPLREATLQA